MASTHYCNPKEGRMNFEQPSVFKETIKNLRPRRHVVEIKEYSPTRSNGANAYYWKIVIPYFCQEWGLDSSIKSQSKYMHYDVLGQELRQIPDELRPGKTKTQTTHDMTGSEFWKYINKCDMLYFDNFNGHFPPPRSLGYDTSKR